MRSFSLPIKSYVLSLGLALTGAAALALIPARSAAQEQPDPAARAAFEAGQDAYDSGHFAVALAQFELSYALGNDPKQLFNIAQAAEAEGKQQRALDAYTSYLQRVPDADNRGFVEARLATLRATKRGSLAAPLRVPPRAAPVELPRMLRIYTGLRLDVGGSISIDDAVAEDHSDLAPSVGAQLGVAHVPNVFGLGLETRFISWNWKDAPTRSWLIDLVLKPGAHFALRTVRLEFYVAIPLGATFAFFDEGAFLKGTSIEPSVGITTGLVGGLNWFFKPKLGVNFEIGVLSHAFLADVSTLRGLEVPTEGAELGELESRGTVTLWQFSPLTVSLIFGR